MRDPELVDPTNPEFAPDATLRLTAGAPEDPFSTQQLSISKHPEIDEALKSSVPISPAGTQKLAQPLAGSAPIRVQRTDQFTKTAGQTLDQPRRQAAPKRLGWRLLMGLGALAVLGVVGYLILSRGRVSPPPPQVTVTPESAPPGAQAYLEQAKAGDAHAMRMLGVMYYYGLNVPQDREKGLYWYRKAAEKGSAAAQAELSKLEGGP